MFVSGSCFQTHSSNNWLPRRARRVQLMPGSANRFRVDRVKLTCGNRRTVMSPHLDESIRTRVYTAADGRAVIEQSGGSTVRLSAEEILTVIQELRVCYDYCAAWNQPTPEDRP